jgi:hypothetical protein
LLATPLTWNEAAYLAGKIGARIRQKQAVDVLSREGNHRGRLVMPEWVPKVSGQRNETNLMCAALAMAISEVTLVSEQYLIRAERYERPRLLKSQSQRGRKYARHCGAGGT